MGAVYGLITLTAIVWSVRRWNAKNQDVGRRHSCLGLIGAVLLGFVIAIPFQMGAQILALSLGLGRPPASNDRQPVSKTSLAVTPVSDPGVCLWLVNAQLLTAKRTSGTSQIVEWFNKYGETGFESPAAIDEFVALVKVYQPYQQQFLDDWVKLGPHVEAKDAWSKELSSNQLRIQALEKIIEGYASSNIGRFNDGLATWEESARVGNEASSVMFEIASRCSTSAVASLPTVTVESTVTPTQQPEPSPTPTPDSARPPSLAGGQTTWVYYEDQDSHFSAYYPETWEPKLIPPEPDNPARGVVFVAPVGSAGVEGNSMISVISLPALDFLGSSSPDSEELKQLLQDVLEDTELTIITPPTETKILGYPAVRLVTETSLSDKNYPIRGYAVATTTDQWIYIIQVIGLAVYDEELQVMYAKFVEGFSPNAP